MILGVPRRSRSTNYVFCLHSRFRNNVSVIDKTLWRRISSVRSQGDGRQKLCTAAREADRLHQIHDFLLKRDNMGGYAELSWWLRRLVNNVLMKWYNMIYFLRKIWKEQMNVKNEWTTLYIKLYISQWYK